MKKQLSKQFQNLLVTGALALAALGAHADVVTASPPDVVDQINAVDNLDFINLSGAGQAQTFMPGTNNITGAGLFVRSGGGTLRISLWRDGFPGRSTGVLLAEGVAFRPGSNNPGWLDVFWSPVAVAPDAAGLLLAFEVPVGATGLMLVAGGTDGTTDGPYDRGTAYGSGFSAFSSIDFTFRTFAPDPNAGPGTAVPAPPTWTLALPALAAVALWRRRERAARR